MRFGVFAALASALFTAACVSFPDAPPQSASPRIDGETIVSIDGAPLGLSVWPAQGPEAVILAVHGMNDYARAFELAAGYWSAHGITVYAYDQRGFGRSPDFGRWAGAATMEADLRAAIAAARAAHPDLPLYVLGHSMGAGLVIKAAGEAPLDVDGAILGAPGLWGGAQLPLVYRMALNISASLAPGKTLTGERTGRRSTDNIAILRQMYEDPYVIKPTRLDAVLGVARLMGAGYRASDDVGGRVLFLYGEKDEIIPVKTMERAAARLCGDVDIRRYEEGWHLIFRDLQAETVWRDVADWVRGEHRGARGFGPARAACAVTGG